LKRKERATEAEKAMSGLYTAVKIKKKKEVNSSHQPLIY